ncbi:MAG: helix-turn-helix transcriptional regulator, partial [Peptococcaceae bacterium]|nr:helix-turn-helix transcriptional regulator [Peptococcaceae bacterium]
MENLRENTRIHHIQHTVDYIEEHIHNRLTMEDISGHVYLSKYHLQRIFKSLTGRGIMEYARSRKLTESLYELLHTDALIVKIAEKYGFEYEQSFTRAFKEDFGLSPSEYRRNPCHVQITPKADPSLLIELDQALIVKPFHVFRPAFELGGLLHQVSIRENLEEFKATSLAVDFFHRHRARITRPIKPEVYYGYTFWGEEKGQYTYYLSGVEIGKETDLPADMKRLVVPSFSYT